MTDNRIHCNVKECVHNKNSCECTLKDVQVTNCTNTTRKTEDTACSSFTAKDQRQSQCCC